MSKTDTIPTNQSPPANPEEKGLGAMTGSRLSECVASVRKYNDWRRGKIDWEDLEPEDVGKFLDEICDRADESEMKLKTIAKKSRSALQTSWLYSGKEHVEKLMREIAEISSENDSIHPPQ